MRQIVLAIETTGIAAEDGHRIVELAAVELVDGHITGRDYQGYFNPERDVDPDAQLVHGLGESFLASQPRFASRAMELINFLSGSDVVAHNAKFDLGFLDRELELAGFSGTRAICSRVIDTLTIAREAFPGERNSLSALCRRLRVSRVRTVQSGALHDALCLADVYKRLVFDRALLETV